MKKNIYISELYPLNYLPTVYATLKTYAEQTPEIASAFNWHPMYCHRTIEEKLKLINSPDIFCASTYIWNWNNQLALCKRVKELYPNCIVVLGGPQVPDTLPDNFFTEHPFVDITVHGEGEIPFTELLRQISVTGDYAHNIPGTSVNKHSVVVRNQCSAKLDKHLYSPPITKALEGLQTESTRINLETNRGCPFNCSFCDWGSSTLSKYRQFPLEKVFSEIEWVGKNKLQGIFFADSNFGTFAHDIDIVKKVAEVKEKYGYPKWMVVNFAKNSNNRVIEIGKLLKEHDLFNYPGVTLSIQSKTQKALDSIGRNLIKDSKYTELTNQLKEANIPYYTEYIIGLPGDSADSFMQGVCDAMDLGLDGTINIYWLAVLPNAPLNDPDYKQKHKIKTLNLPMDIPINFEIKETCEYVVSHKDLSQEDWVKMACFGAFIKFVHNKSYFKELIKFLHETQSIRYSQSVLDLFKYFYSSPSTLLGGVLSEARMKLSLALKEPEKHDRPLICIPDNIFALRVQFFAEFIVDEAAKFYQENYSVKSQNESWKNAITKQKHYLSVLQKPAIKPQVQVRDETTLHP